MTRLKGRARVKANKKNRNKRKYDAAVYRKKMAAKILKYNDPFLKIVCDSVPDYEDVTEIVTELKKVLAATKNGVGIAASQIGYNKRIIAIRPTGWQGNISVLINPVIEKQSDEKQIHKEGCLSYPDFYTPVERSKKATIKYIDDDEWQEKTVEFKDFEARIILHEIDHLDGKCFVGDAWRARETDE